MSRPPRWWWALLSLHAAAFWFTGCAADHRYRIGWIRGTASAPGWYCTRDAEKPDDELVCTDFNGACFTAKALVEQFGPKPDAGQGMQL